MRESLLILLVNTFSCVSFSQETDIIPELITDRPDATESPNTVPKGYIQIETGAFYEADEENALRSETYVYNTTLLRYGILNNLEFRLGWNFEEVRFETNGIEADNVLSGFSPLLAGMKLEVVEETGLIPEIGLLGHLYLPFFAASDYRPETTGVDIRFSFAHTLSNTSGLAYNLGAQWLDDTGEAAYVYSLVYGHSIFEKLGVYAELYGDLPEDSRSNHFWDAGFTYLLKPNVQLDATVGSGLSGGQDMLLSIGMSVRIPK
tara:strand:+ start:344444 stop:345229 length:786 start_codon:yes stop_codon:yes gene_type:complete